MRKYLLLIVSILLLMVSIASVVTSLIFRYLVTTNKIKTNKISKNT